jgi:IS605 OrfB family transposase
MQRTVSLKLKPTLAQREKLSLVQSAYSNACNLIVPTVVEHRCWNRVTLHHLVYYPVREQSPLNSQMVCNAIYSVCLAYKALKARGEIKRNKPIPKIEFKQKSVHYDKRTYAIKSDNVLSLYTMQGREYIPYALGDFQCQYLEQGQPKEAELVLKNKQWYFNLVLDLPDPPEQPPGKVLGVDLGENNLVTTSSGKVISGKELCFKRDKYLNFRNRVQSNGSKSAKQLLNKTSGREQRHVKHVNHEISKAIVQEAQQTRATVIALEDLTHIRQNIKARKRVRTRLHRWAWRQLQTFIEYKAQAMGMLVVYVNPAYTSQTCSVCGQKGVRQKHRFSCSCGNLAHADLNASQNIAKLAVSIVAATGAVNRPNVGNLQVVL